MPPLRVERLLPQWATARVAPTAFLCGDSERRVQEAAPYKGRIPPERAGEDTRPYCGCGSILSFRRGRTLAGLREGHTPGWLLSAFGRFTFSPSPANPQENFPDMGRGAPWGSRRELFGSKGRFHPPRIRSAPSPWKGEGFRVVRCADPTSEGEETFPLIRLTFGQPPSPRGRLVLPALARQSQARKGNRTSNNFCKPRAQWPGRDWYQPLRFCAPEMLLRLSSTRLP